LEVICLCRLLQTVDARGPREPWHDLHSKINGPAAYDVLQNFQERWIKASKRHGIKKLAKSYDDALLSIERIPEIININDAAYFSDNDPETWHVQVLYYFCSLQKIKEIVFHFLF
jgi:phospholipase D1/2